MAAIRCTCGMFLKKDTNSCSRCDVSYEATGSVGIYGEPMYKGSNGSEYLAVNNRLQYIHREVQNTIPKEEKKMSFFNFDPKQAGSNMEPVPAGEYEVIISEAKVDTFKSGNRGIKITLTIRDDIEQEGGKRKVFDNFVEVPEASFKFHNLAAGLMWGEGDSAENLEDYAAKVRYQSVRAKLKVVPATAQYPAKNEVVTYLPSQTAAHSGAGFGAGGSDPFQNDGKPIDISDDDLPF